eukprot:scaffold107328_cov45-Phaeocystis_antarctica.AAC.1
MPSQGWPQRRAAPRSLGSLRDAPWPQQPALRIGIPLRMGTPLSSAPAGSRWKTPRRACALQR